MAEVNDYYDPMGRTLTFRKLTGTTRAFLNIKRILGRVNSGQARCGGRFSRRTFLQISVARHNN
jgi:hypothetical protein